MFYNYNPFEATKNDLAGLYNEMYYETHSPRKENIYCKRCKTTLIEFLETGFVGCNQCYQTFFNDAKSFAFDVHGMGAHVGKAPKKEATKSSKMRELESLIAEKEKALRIEDYDKAKELKRRIDILREELK